MTLALDTDVLVAWNMSGAPAHLPVRRLIEREIGGQGQLAVTAQVLFEFIHVVTDSRRFESPLDVSSAIDRAREIWNAKDVVRLEPATTVLHRTLELMGTHRLGRKRILDTALAATLESAGVERLATFNGRDFRVFSFIEVVEPS
jgi:predicted nucleic acid-binding protein